MMKKLLYMILAVFALLSCVDGLDRHGAQQEGIVLTVYNSPMTKVADVGEAYERTLSSLDCFFFDGGRRNGAIISDLTVSESMAINDVRYKMKQLSAILDAQMKR